MPANDLPHSSVDAFPPSQTFRRVMATGEAKVAMPLIKAFSLAMLAGAFIGFGGMLLLLVKADPDLSFASSALLSGCAFSLGLFAVLVAGAELFTGNSLMAIGALAGRYSWRAMLYKWLVVYAGNLAGAVTVAMLLTLARFDSLAGGAMGEAIASVASAKCSLPFQVLLVRGILCNILVCLSVWMGFAGRTVVDKFLASLMPVMAFVACGFEHCVANMMLLPLAAMTCPAGTVPSLAAMAGNIGVVTLGNVIGGAVLFAGAYWVAFNKD